MSYVSRILRLPVARAVALSIHSRNGPIASASLRRPFSSGSDEHDKFKSLLSSSNVRSPYADPTRTRNDKSESLIEAAQRRQKEAGVTQSTEQERKAAMDDSTELLRELLENRGRAAAVAPATKKVVETKKKAEERVPVEFVEESMQEAGMTHSAEQLTHEIEEQYRKAHAITSKTSAFKRFKDNYGLSIDESASDEEKKRQKTTRNTKLGAFFVFGSSIVGLVAFCLYYGAAERDADGKPIRDEFSGMWFAPLYRIHKAYRSWHDYVVEPSRDKLLPDPLPAGYIQPKYTLVIEMKHVLVDPEWTYKTGYRFKLRPALDYFLDVVGYPNFEVVIYTQESSMTADPIVTGLDPKNRIMYRLYRDCTKYHNGHHIKDLSRLNRDLSKVIHIDFDPNSFSLHPENVLRVPKWSGDMNDTSLVDLAELLKTIHLSDVEDVRPVLEYYSGFDDPAKEFRKRAIYLAEQEAASKSASEAGEGQSLVKRYTGRLFGFRRHASA